MLIEPLRGKAKWGVRIHNSLRIHGSQGSSLRSPTLCCVMKPLRGKERRRSTPWGLHITAQGRAAHPVYVSLHAECTP